MFQTWSVKDGESGGHSEGREGEEGSSIFAVSGFFKSNNDVGRVDDVEGSVIEWLGFSGVTNEVGDTHGGLVGFKLSLGHWINGGENVPVDNLTAWWGGQGSLVVPSGRQVKSVQPCLQVERCNGWGRWVSSPVELVQKWVSNVLGGIEEDTQNESRGPVIIISVKVDEVNFHVVLLSVDGVLGVSVEVELLQVPVVDFSSAPVSNLGCENIVVCVIDNLNFVSVNTDVWVSDSRKGHVEVCLSNSEPVGINSVVDKRRSIKNWSTRAQVNWGLVDSGSTCFSS